MNKDEKTNEQRAAAADTQAAANADNTADNTANSKANADASTNAQAADSTAEAQAATEEKDPLTAAQEELDALRDKYLRSVAEFDNYRKRTLKEKAELILGGSERAVTAFLPVIDDMERALASAEKTDDAEVLREGMRLIAQKMAKALGELGVKAIDTAGKAFNTDLHEAVAMVPGVPADQQGMILDCVQTGYTLGDRVIRYAKVAVGQEA